MLLYCVSRHIERGWNATNAEEDKSDRTLKKAKAADVGETRSAYRSCRKGKGDNDLQVGYTTNSY